MLIKEFPVIIIAAGKGKRMGNEFQTGNKALLKINKKISIIDYLLIQLIKLGINKIIIITGYQSEKITNHLKQFNENLRNTALLEDFTEFDIFNYISIVQAREDFEKGPLFTLLTIHDRIEFSQLSSFYTLLPSDTIFNDEIISTILNTDIPSSDLDSLCKFFIYKSGKKELSNWNKELGFTYNVIKESDNQNQSISIQIPILTFSKVFFTFIEQNMTENSFKVSDILKEIDENDRRFEYKNIKPPKLDFPPYLDIDTSEIFENLSKWIKDKLDKAIKFT